MIKQLNDFVIDFRSVIAVSPLDEPLNKYSIYLIGGHVIEAVNQQTRSAADNRFRYPRDKFIKDWESYNPILFDLDKLRD